MKRLWLPVVLILVCVAPLRADAPDTKKTVAWLQGLQQSDGGFPASTKPTAAGTLPTSLRATSSAIRALKYFGGELPNKEKVAQFVDAAFDKASGGFRDTPSSEPDVSTTAVGLMAVAELKLPVDRYAKAVDYLAEKAKTFEEVRIAAAGL